MHDEKNLIHRDLKRMNVLISNYEDLTQCQIIDFGLASQNRRENLYEYGEAGTLIYQPPEQLLKNYNYGKGADIWAAGIAIYELLTNSHPFFRGTETSQEKRDFILGFEKLEFSS